jgi:hypothetical protein
LKKSGKVNSFDKEGKLESETLAHSLLDISESSHTLLNELFPKLELNNLSEEEINGLLIEIGEELRHIFYHIKDSTFYNYLNEAKH